MMAAMSLKAQNTLPWFLAVKPYLYDGKILAWI